MTPTIPTCGAYGNIIGISIHILVSRIGRSFPLTFPSKKYLTVGEDLEVSMSEVGERAGGGVRWWKSRTRCGLVIEEVSQRDAGDWLCHLAETSSHQGKVKDERAIQVFIASRASIRLSMEPDDISQATVGTEIKISCVSGNLQSQAIRKLKYSYKIN